MKLTGKQQGALEKALLEAFSDWAALRKLLRYQLDENLAAITSESKNISVNVFELLEWARERDLFADLIIAARNQNPRSKALLEFAESVHTAPSTRGLESIVGGNRVQLDPEAWREGLARAEWRTCRIDIHGEGRGTAFLVGPDLVITNYHVIEHLDPGNADALARFDYKATDQGTVITEGVEVKFAADWLIAKSTYSRFDLEPDPKTGDPTAEELDFALIRLERDIANDRVGKNQASEERGYFQLEARALPKAPTMLAILQHPAARPLKLAIGMAEQLVVNRSGTRVRHGLPTEPGSSGSPVFDQHWNVVALHHSGDPDTIRPTFNEAIPIELVAAKVRSAVGP